MTGLDGLLLLLLNLLLLDLLGLLLLDLTLSLLDLTLSLLDLTLSLLYLSLSLSLLYLTLSLLYLSLVNLDLFLHPLVLPFNLPLPLLRLLPPPFLVDDAPLELLVLVAEELAVHLKLLYYTREVGRLRQGLGKEVVYLPEVMDIPRRRRGGGGRGHGRGDLGLLG